MATTTAPLPPGPTPPATPSARTGPGRPGLVVAAMSTTILLWASAFIGIRAVAHDLDPGPLTLGRVAVGTLTLTVLVGIARHRRRTHGRPAARLPRGRALALVAVWGVAWFGGYNMALNAAEQHLDAGTTSMLINLAPVLIAVLAGLLLGEGFPRRLLTGMAVALAGVVLIAVATSNGRFDAAGVALALVAALLYAGSAVLQKRILPGLDALTMTWLGCAAGTLAALPFLPALLDQLAAAPAPVVAGVVYLGVFPTAIAFSTWGYVLARTDAGRTAASAYAIPPLTVLLSWILLDEVPPPVALAGGALALAGVAVATLPRRARRAGSSGTRRPTAPA
ncbi:DMT family transporter [Isoptericola chiayiensis]|uniref:DMT family transporter n=1 Tax=Isoptericola chiayiensis TaxID=579446 RepID=A0ABP8Y3H2_9MICO|nr:DMT family transporter [Isoptericola chiayiensis]NOV99400.1 drug/metabolite transporter (DMT)-like permease [Isoptericola chiayiensis]